MIRPSVSFAPPLFNLADAASFLWRWQIYELGDPPSDYAEAAMLARQHFPQAGIHFADNFFTWGRNNSMFDDQPFVEAWEANIETAIDRAIVWRRYVLACAAHHCVQLDGDFVECGAYTGVGVKIVADYLGGM